MASQEELSAALDDVTRKLEELSRVLPNVPQNMNATGTESLAMSKGLSIAGQAAGKMAGAFTDAMGAMYQGQKGLKAFDSAIDKTADALMVLTGALALVGGPITLLAAGLTAAVAAGAKYVKATNEQSDKLYDAFQQMSRSGGAAADGLQGLYNDVQKLGGGIQDLDKFVSLIASNSKDLATFGGTVFEGRREFARLGKEMEPFRQSLMNAGMTQDEINEASMGYLKLQSRIGATQNKTTTELAESTRKYLLEQDALTKLTGLTRKEQEDAREAIRSQEVFAGKLLQLRNKGADGAAKQLEDTFLVLQKDSKEVGQGFADISSGNLRTEAAQKLMRATQGEAMRVQQELSDGQITAAQAADRISQALKRNVDMYGETQGVLGNYNSTYGDLAGQITIASRQLTGGYEKQLAAIEANARQQGMTGNKAADAEVQRQTELRLSQQKAMQNMQDFVRLGVDPATKATSAFGKAIEAVTGLLPGAKTPAGAPAQPAPPSAKPGGQNVDAAKSGLTAQQAKNILESGSKRDIQAFGGREVLEKIAGIQKAAAPGAGGKSGAYPSSGPTSGAQPVAGTDGRVSSPQQAGGVPSSGPQKTAADSPIASIVDSRPGEITVTTTDGQTQKRQGAANWRMNNPGNLRMTPWVRSQGGVVGEGDAGPSGKFAVFSTLDAGRQAKENLLFGGGTVYSNLDLRQAMYKYAPPSDNNPTENYLQDILKATGASDTTKLAELSQNQRDSMLAAIEKFEGFKPGKIYAAADGGIVKEKLGGTMVWAGEAGQDEAVVPLKNGNIPVSFTGSERIVEALQRITDEFKSSISQITNGMRNNQQSVLNEEALAILRSIETATRSGSDAQNQLLRVAQN